MVVVDVRGRVVSDADDELVLPGFVNAHSHAFQRALRGRVEIKSAANPDDDFWSWRTAMYGDAARVTPEDVFALAAWAYGDMLKAGFTAVGEFHYLHHDEAGVPYAGPEMSLALARAAAHVGIRLVLLETAYVRGGVDKPLSREQRRFAHASPEAFLAHVDDVRRRVSGLGARVGVAAHSVRACPRPMIEAVAAYARREGLPLHVHACEQRKELEECRREHGMSPIALLHEAGALGPFATVVHGTHLSGDDIERLGATGTTVCATPSTERNLGDGIGPFSSLAARGVPLCVGTDSHARIDAVDELRSLEDHERLRTERRNVLNAPGERLAHAVIPCGTTNGARSLGLSADDTVARDRIEVAMPLEGRTGDVAAGLDAWLVGGSSRDVRAVSIDGRVVVSQGRLVSADDDAIAAGALHVLRKLRA